MRKKFINLAIVICLILIVAAVIYQKNMGSGNLDAETIAVVNDFKITKEYYQDEYNNLSAEQQKIYNNDQIGFLEELIIKELLYQEAIKRKIVIDEKNIADSQLKNSYINKLFEQVFGQIIVTENEKKEFFEANQNQMNGLNYQDVEYSIGNYLLQQKQTEEIQNLIKSLQDSAKIIKNEKWLSANKPEDPVSEVLKNGKPTVLDLGSSSCVPCQMMQPILEELQKEYEGKANILVIDVYEYRNLAREYSVKGIPTQIFFDENGTQVWRHVGFLAKEEIIKKLQEMGVSH